MSAVQGEHCKEVTILQLVITTERSQYVSFNTELTCKKRHGLRNSKRKLPGSILGGPSLFGACVAQVGDGDCGITNMAPFH